MKKMMTAFAACMIAGLVSAAVESANIVGYQTTTASAGFTVYTPTFTTVGGGNPTFKCIGGTFSSGDQIQFFDAGGNVSDTAVYCTMDSDFVEDGWYQTDGVTSIADTEIPSGKSFFVSVGAEVEMVVSGEVSSSNIEVNCDAGFTPMGNARPYNITFGDLLCVNVQSGDQIQFFDASGNVSDTAVYCTMDSDFVEDGWYQTDGVTSLAATEILSGQGFFFSSSSGGSTITIPALF